MATAPGQFNEIWIAEGTYKPTKPINADTAQHVPNGFRMETFLFAGVTVLGGFPAGGGDGTGDARDPEQYVTILSGDIDTDGEDDAYHVVLLFTNPDGLNATTLDGLTIKNGKANGSDHDSVGGGIHVYDFQETEDFPGKPNIINCKIIDNYALNAGGGMNSRKAGAFLRDCEFRNNSTGGSGFEEYVGGGGFMGVGPVDAINCIFVSNSTTNQGGGGLHSEGATKLVNCEFYGNSAPAGGGADINGNGETTGVAVNCLFAGNHATSGDGGGLVALTVHNCTFADNKASGEGGGASISRATNSIFWGNQGTTSDEPYEAQMTVACPNFRDPSQMFPDGGNSRWNLIQDWACPGGTSNCCTPETECPCITTITTTDPKFVLPGDADDAPSATFEFNNYRLAQTSPAINSGDPSLSNATPGYFPEDEFDADGDLSENELTPELDLGDRVAVVTGGASGIEVIDRGAYEVPCITGCGSDCVTSATFAPPPDGTVDAADLAYLLGEWGTPAPNSPSCADTVTSATFAPPPDGNVDAADLALLLGAWGWCCGASQGGQGLMGGGEGGGESMTSGEGSGGESGGAGESISVGPYEGSYIGLLLQELIATNDPDLAALIAELLAESSEE